MSTATSIGQAGLQGWRAKVGDAVADPISRRTPLDPSQVRAAVGAAFIALSGMYLVKAAKEIAAQRR